MAPESKKRTRPIAKMSQRSHKRQRIEAPKKGRTEKKSVPVDALPWNEVKLPDMFNDAEGFYGLEEVEGVEVLREDDRVKFVCIN